VGDRFVLSSTRRSTGDEETVGPGRLVAGGRQRPAFSVSEARPEENQSPRPNGVHKSPRFIQHEESRCIGSSRGDTRRTTTRTRHRFVALRDAGARGLLTAKVAEATEAWARRTPTTASRGSRETSHTTRFGLASETTRNASTAPRASWRWGAAAQAPTSSQSEVTKRKGNGCGELRRVAVTLSNADIAEIADRDTPPGRQRRARVYPEPQNDQRFALGSLTPSLRDRWIGFAR